MIVELQRARYKVTKLRKRNALGIYLVEEKKKKPFTSYEPLFYAATKRVALAQVRKRHIVLGHSW